MIVPAREACCDPSGSELPPGRRVPEVGPRGEFLRWVPAEGVLGPWRPSPARGQDTPCSCPPVRRVVTPHVQIASSHACRPLPPAHPQGRTTRAGRIPPNLPADVFSPCTWCRAVTPARTDHVCTARPPGSPCRRARSVQMSGIGRMPRRRVLGTTAPHRKRPGPRMRVGALRVGVSPGVRAGSARRVSRGGCPPRETGARSRPAPRQLRRRAAGLRPMRR